MTAVSQADFDLDGYGTACDPDFDQTGTVGIPDFNALGSIFGCSATDTPAQCPTLYDGIFPDLADFELIDIDGTGTIGIPDFNTLGSLFGGPPGPSGLACADPTGATAPCVAQ